MEFSSINGGTVKDVIWRRPLTIEKNLTVLYFYSKKKFRVFQKFIRLYYSPEKLKILKKNLIYEFYSMTCYFENFVRLGHAPSFTGNVVRYRFQISCSNCYPRKMHWEKITKLINNPWISSENRERIQNLWKKSQFFK